MNIYIMLWGCMAVSKLIDRCNVLQLRSSGLMVLTFPVVSSCKECTNPKLYIVCAKDTVTVVPCARLFVCRGLY